MLYVVLAITAVVITGSFGLAAGSAIVGLFVGLYLAGYEPPAPLHNQAVWEDYDLLLVDRRRKIILVGYKNQPMLGYAMLVSRKELNGLIDLMKSLMPTAEYREHRSGWLQ